MIYFKKYFENYYCIDDDDDDDVAITMIGEGCNQNPEGSVPINESTTSNKGKQ